MIEVQKKLSLAKYKWLKHSIDYWEGIVNESDMGCDWNEAAIMCWRCGCKRMTQRCHIVPKSLGGGDGPENIVALCAMCHDEAPNVADSDAMWSWIKKTGSSNCGGLYGTYWFVRAMKSVASEQGVGFDDLARKIKIDKLKDNLKKCGHHFGQSSGGSRLTLSTIEWAVRMSVEDCKELQDEVHC